MEQEIEAQAQESRLQRSSYEDSEESPSDSSEAIVYRKTSSFARTPNLRPDGSVARRGRPPKALQAAPTFMPKKTYLKEENFDEYEQMMLEHRRNKKQKIVAPI